MGFLNPWLYKKGYQGFTDVAKGSAVSGACNSTGFEAVEGWDAVTGFGTPVSFWVLRYEVSLQLTPYTAI